MNIRYDDVASWLQRLEVPLVAAEAHGMLCGLLCSLRSESAKGRWMTELLDAGGVEPSQIAAHADDVKGLDQLFSDTVEKMNGSDLDFAPLLPSDDDPLSLRTAALADFCAGFTYGLGIGVAGRGSRALPADTQELVNDFQAIEAVDPTGSEASSDEESAFVELSEYVRVGVLWINEELQPVAPAKTNLH